MTTPNGRRRTRRRKPTPTPYRTLYDGAAGEPAAPNKLRAVLTMLDDARSTELWLRHGAVAVEAEDPGTAGGEIAGRRHLTRIGWTTIDDRRLRSAVYEGKTATEDDVDDIVEHAVTCTAWEIEIAKCIRACGPHDDEMFFDTAIESLSIRLADGRSLEHQKDDTPPEHNPAHFIVNANIFADRTVNASLTQPVNEDGETHEIVPANPRVQMCLDWLCSQALRMMRNGAANGPPNIIEAMLSEEPNSTPDPPAESADTGKDPAAPTEAESVPEQETRPDADRGPSNSERGGPAERTGNGSDAHRSRYRYH